MKMSGSVPRWSKVGLKVVDTATFVPLPSDSVVVCTSSYITDVQVSHRTKPDTVAYRNGVTGMRTFSHGCGSDGPESDVCVG